MLRARELEKALKEETQRQKEELKARQEANKKKREENARKTEVVQLVSLLNGQLAFRPMPLFKMVACPPSPL